MDFYNLALEGNYQAKICLEKLAQVGKAYTAVPLGEILFLRTASPSNASEPVQRTDSTFRKI